MGQDGGGGGVGAQRKRGGDGQEAESRGRGSKGLKEWEVGEIVGGGGRITQKKFSIYHNRKGLKGGRQEKKGQDPEMQGTGCGRHGPPVPPPPTTFQTWTRYLFA